MKRMAAILLALAMLSVGVAQAGEWAEGTSPAKPYPDQPEINLEEQLGYMMFYPQAGAPVENACQRLYIYLPREDVRAGEGTLYLFTDEDGQIWDTAMNNTDAVTVRAISEDELDGLLWGGGTCFEVLLPRTLELGKTYYVNMTRGCVVADGGAENPQIGGTSWSFAVEGEYGVSGMEYLRPLGNGQYEERVAHPRAGDEIRFDLVLGGEAAIAAIYKYHDSVDFLTTTFDESCEVTGEVMGENLVWGVMFLDGEGRELSRVEFW